MPRAIGLIALLPLAGLLASASAFWQSPSDVDAAPPGAAPTDSARIRLVLNIPAFRLDVIEGELLTRTFTVAVGMPRYPTPRGSFVITSIEWNPWWIPPPAEWAANERVTPPGSHNPMGRVKLSFRTYYFFHGTPLEESLGHAASHGCVRMANTDAIALARLVHRYASPEVSAEEIDGWLLDTARTRRVAISELVSVELTYEVAEVRGDSLLLHPDIYGLARDGIVARALAVLTSAAYDTAMVDRTRLAAAATEARRRPTAIALTDLLIPAHPSALSPPLPGGDGAP